MKTLRDVKTGQTARIKQLHSTGAVKCRMAEMGLTKGTEVLVKRRSPLGDPAELTVRGYELLIRKAEMKLIEVE